MTRDPEDDVTAAFAPLWNEVAARTADLELDEAVTTSLRPQTGETLDPDATAELPWAAELPETAVTVDLGAGGGAEPGRSAGGAAEGELHLLEVLGEGGMGKVFRARQGSLGREVAVKQLHDGAAASPGKLQEFLVESRVTARLEHANIVPVHLLGRAGEGTPQLVMKLVRGRPWSSLVQEGELELHEHLRILIAVCNAIAYAHELGVLHRDLKLANVMVAEHGQVFVVDWGLAVSLGDDGGDDGLPRASTIRSVAGTPAYMAPEQAVADGAAHGSATDVYLLGACLYHVITGRPPHRGKSLMEVLAHAAQSEPVEFGGDVPAELAAICRRAMARDPDARHASAIELRDAVEAFLEHRQATRIARDGLARIEPLAREVDAHAAAVASGGSADELRPLHRRIHDHYLEASFAFETAARLWAESPEALEGRQRSAAVMLEHALATDDLALAEQVLPQCTAEDAADRVAALRHRIEARDDEVSRLEAELKRSDWREVAESLGNVFLFAGVLAIPLHLAIYWLAGILPPEQAFLAQLPMVLFFLGVPAMALWQVRRRSVDTHLPRKLLDVWGGVLMGCVLVAVTARIRNAEPFSEICYACLLIASGFSSMAATTSRWFLLPTAGFFLGGLYAAAVVDHALAIIGTLLTTSCLGFGFALKTGSLGSAPSRT